MHQSIVRRSLVVMAFYVVGHGFNYLLLVTSNRMLPPELFGLFYISLLLCNVLETLGFVLVMSMAQRFSGLAAAGGLDGVVVDLHRILRAVLKWGAVAALAAAAGLSVVGRFLGVESFAIVLLIPAVAFTEVLFEIIRAGFQALQRFAWFSISWVIRCGVQYVAAIMTFSLIGTVWAGMSGILAATIAVCAIAWLALLPRKDRLRSAALANPTPLLTREVVVPQLLAYGQFTLLVNLDVLLGYFLLSREQLGVYAASSILPKAIVTATLPVAQVLLPVVASRSHAGESARLAIVKAVMAVLGLAIFGAAVLWLGGGIACGSRLGIRFCDLSLMTVLALAAIPLAMLRLLVVSNLALGAGNRPVLLTLGVVAFALIAALGARGDVHHLAALYLAVSSGAMVLYLAADLVSGRWHVAKRAAQNAGEAPEPATRPARTG